MFEDHLSGRVQLANGDSRDVLKSLPDSSIDSVVCDPPYALVSIVKRFGKEGSAPAHGDVYARASAGFMGKQWDTGETAFAAEFWAEVLRVLKPGGHVIAFSGTRTYHRLAVAIEDAGFEIRDMVLEYIESDTFLRQFFHSLNEEQQRAFVRMIDESMFGGMLAWNYGSGFPKSHNQPGGWGTALKPACEPIVLARKPLAGTVAANMLAHGTGALNIDGCRIGDSGARNNGRSVDSDIYGKLGAFERVEYNKGRWPANVIHDGSDEVVGAFPEAPGQQAAVGGQDPDTNVYGEYGPRPTHMPRLDSGSAARFFYTAKADALDRVGSKHPTVKPVDLMQYLCRLVTPPGGIVLDPFAGSGTTGEAAWREGFRAILIEREAEYCEDIRRRLSLADKGEATRKRASGKPRVADSGPQVSIFS